jgi:hypothetical protein
LYEFVHGSPVPFPTDAEIDGTQLSLADIHKGTESIKDSDWMAICDEDEEKEDNEKQFSIVLVQPPSGAEIFVPDASFQVESIVAFDNGADKKSSDIVLWEHSAPAGESMQLSPEAKAFIEKRSQSATPEEILEQGLQQGLLPPTVGPRGIVEYLDSIGRHIMTDAERAFIDAATIMDFEAAELAFPGSARLREIITEGQAD